MPTLTPAQQRTKDTTDGVLRSLLKGPKTLGQLGCSRHRLDAMIEAKLVKRGGEVKGRGSSARKSVTFELMAKGRKRAEKP